MLTVFAIAARTGATGNHLQLSYARTLIRAGLKDAAHCVLDRALRLPALMRKAGSQFATLYCRLGDHESCIAAAKAINAVLPADLDVLLTLANCLYEIGDDEMARQLYERLVALNLDFARNYGCFIRLAFLYGRLRRSDVALSHYAMHYERNPLEPQKASTFGFAVSRLEDKARRFLRTVDQKVVKLLRSVPATEGRTAIFFFSPGNAIGHAVLEPFWLLNLVAGRYERVIVIGATQAASTPPVRVALQVVDQYVERIETNDESLINLWWMDFGDIKTARFTYIFRDYRRLARSIYDARMDPAHPLAAGRKQFELPPAFGALGDEVAAANGLDLSRPIVVIHVREHGYHQLGVQAFRNARMSNYLPAIRMLIDSGYLVVRVGDSDMSRVPIDSPHFVDLPHQPYASPFLDPYFISRARFMIACQSGPCAYARAFGVPILSLNAVYHYSLIPEAHELVGFKHYRKAVGGRNVALSFADVVASKLHQLETTQQFTRAGLVLDELSSEEVTAATNEMLDWLADPTRKESALQARFREIALTAADATALEAEDPRVLRSYLGYALPTCRVSDAIVRLRPGYL